MQKIWIGLLGLLLITLACGLSQAGSVPVKSSTPSLPVSLSSTLQIGSKTPQPASSPETDTPAPGTATEVQTPEPTLELTPTRPSQPVIADIYPLSPYTGSGLGLDGVLAISPGRVWAAGSALGTVLQKWDPDSGTPHPGTQAGIQEWDANTGKLLGAIPLPGFISFRDMKYEGQTLWVLASKKDANYADTLFALNLPDGKVVKEWDTLTEMNEEDVINWSANRLGVSPGKIWAADKVIDTQTLEEIKSISLPLYAHFAYDGQRWMWIIGDRCDGCGNLWMFDAGDPRKVKDKGGTGPHGELFGAPIVQANGKMWMGAVKNIKNVSNLLTGTPYLQAYDINQTDHPSLEVDISGELGEWDEIGLLAADNHVLWLGENHYGSKTLSYHDQTSGKLLGSLSLDTAGIADMVFDGKNIWVLDADDLVRVALPWAP